MTTIAIVNQSTVLSDDQVQPVVAALQKQVSGDFAPLWGVDANVVFVPQGQTPPDGAWWMVVLDNSDQAGALGYHDLTPDGLPIGKIFAQSDLQAGTSWSVTLSHELLEMLGDPDVNLTCIVEDAVGNATAYAYEICDPVQDDALGYLIDGILVSNFVLPSWFESFRTQGPFDFKGVLGSPLMLAAGGYLSKMDFLDLNGWTQVSARLLDTDMPVGSRRHRRSMSRRHWKRSERRPVPVPVA